MSRARLSLLPAPRAYAFLSFLTSGFDGLYDVAFFPWSAAADYRQAVANLNLHIIGFGNGLKSPCRGFDPQARTFMKTKAFANRFRHDQATGFAKSNGNVHANKIAIFNGTRQLGILYFVLRGQKMNISR